MKGAGSKGRVLLADDHRILLEGLRGFLSNDFEIVGAVEDGRAVIDAARHLRPDLVVMDISMPGLNGIDAAKQLKKVDESIKVVFLTMHTEIDYVVGAFDAGASGLVLKHSAPEELIKALTEALQGRTYVTPIIAGELLTAYRQVGTNPAQVKAILSPRQREVLQLLAEGKSAKEIASCLDISAKTVEFHKYRMMQQIGLRTGAELIQYAVKCGLTSR